MEINQRLATSRVERQMAMALIAMALPTEIATVNNKAELPRIEDPPKLPPNFIVRPAQEIRGPERRAYIGEVVHVNANPDEVCAIVNDLRERRRLNNLRKML